MSVPQNRKLLTLSLIVLCTAPALLFVRAGLLHPSVETAAAIYNALDVGQGDATLIELPDGVRILTDAGVDQSVVSRVADILGDEQYIDIGIVTHPQKDHFYGFIPLLKRYRFGAILWNGRVDASDQKNWDVLVAEAERLGIPLIRIGRGDVIRTASMRADVLSPGSEYLESGELNDTSIVMLFQTQKWRVLLTGDIDTTVEHDLVGRFGEQLRADILKVPHHGSKYSSSAEFIAVVQPRAATISLSARNTYGHPSPEALERYAAAGAHVFRTDKEGSVRLSP